MKFKVGDKIKPRINKRTNRPYWAMAYGVVSNINSGSYTIERYYTHSIDGSIYTANPPINSSIELIEMQFKLKENRPPESWI